MAELHKMVITINGMKYPITTRENERYVSTLGHEIDKGVRQLMDHAQLSVNEALVLLCLNYLDSYKKSEQAADNLRSQIAEYLEEAAKARAETGEAKKELAQLQKKLKEKDNKEYSHG